jgi:hypothetical protein
MILRLNSFGRGFSPLSNLNIKLSSFTVLERKERKEDTHCVLESTEIYWPLYWLLQLSYLVFILWWIYYDPFLDLLGTSTIVDWHTLRSPHEWTTSVLISTGWLSIFCYTVRCRTGFITNNLSGSCHIRYRVFPVKTPAFVLTVQWVVNPLCTYTLYCVPYSCLLAY